MRKTFISLTSVLLLIPAAPAPGAEPAAVEEARLALHRLTGDLEIVIGESPPRTVSPPSSPEADGDMLPSRAEQAKAVIRAVRVGAYESLMPLVGDVPLSDAGGELLAMLDTTGDPDPAGEELQGLMLEWAVLRNALDRATDAMNRLRLAEDLPPAAASCPVEGPFDFDRDWGESRGSRTHSGVDLTATAGTPLTAIESGTIIQADYHQAGGNGLYLRATGAGDVYYYAHMADYAPDVAAGASVDAGDLLGWMGATGNADVPHLHLGWMPGSGTVDLGALRDPYPLIVELCR